LREPTLAKSARVGHPHSGLACMSGPPAGAIYYVESKFGTSHLSAAQRLAANALGPAYHVEKWTYPFFERVGAYLGVGYGMVGATSSRPCGCN